ncbi:threonine aldolase family protein [Oceanomicrobium pacificus]|uniref:L-threonine aldolase n=1 Tax=Oceanomicrobium pacificus TaxID=2692916 RepID=A0A6B0TR67_9RHOB|nr:beta-eliminating lyase-related protein [Oceanomicrobium pacificus]MXU64238.1 low specificity L-threonine aldolase [Oceanomicrobium pacificus]
MWFTSDNAGPAAPEVMAAVQAANEGFAWSYGEDALMAEVEAQIRDQFEAPDAKVYLVATGSAANSISLACLTPPWGAIYCHPLAHVEIDECGGPEFYTGGAKLVLVDGQDGKMDPDALALKLAAARVPDVHHVQKSTLSLTNVTEMGTLYTPAELGRLTSLAKDAGLRVHLDGARFSNAVAALGCSPAELSWKAGVDMLSFGGTKNGCMGVEAVVLFDPDLAWEFELRRKRGAHLFSKHRFLSAQMAAYLKDGLWLDLAARANRAAARLAAGLGAMEDVTLLAPVEANMIFLHLSEARNAAAEAGGVTYYSWPDLTRTPDEKAAPLAARLVCDWSKTDAEIDRTLAAFAG